MEHLEAVGVAFDALLLTVYRLTHRHNELKQHAVDVFTQVSICVSFVLVCDCFLLPDISSDERI